MPKRKKVDQNYEQLYIKLKKIEEELEQNRKAKRRRLRISSSLSSSSSTTRLPETNGCGPPSPVSAVSDQENDEVVVSSPATDKVAPSAVVHAAATAVALGVAPAAPARVDEAGSDSVPVISDDIIPELDADILDILGVDPTKTNNFGKDIQKDVAVRFEHTTTTGLTRDDRKELTDKYLIPVNCKLVGAPALNPEIKAALSEMVIKRDKVIESKQRLMASAISSLGEAITLLLASKDKNTDILRLLIDTGRTLCDCQHNDTVTRRNFIIYSVKKEMKESLQNAKVDNFLFGQNLPDTLKAAKAICRSGSELKAAPLTRPTPSKKNMPSTSKNWKNPGRKQQATWKTKEAATTSTATTKNHRTSSSGQSQSRRPAPSRR